MFKSKSSSSRPRKKNARPEGKAATNVLGFDDATHGGLPRGGTTIVFGGPGSGKTIFALQTLVGGARQWNEPGIFVAFEESSAQILRNAKTFGWDIPHLQRRKLFFLDASLRPDIVRAGKFDLSAVLAGLADKAAQISAKRIVFDGVDVLLTMLGDPYAERLELSRLHRWAAAHGLTAIVTAKIDANDTFTGARYSQAAYMADCALLLARRHDDDVSERDVCILKYRGSTFFENKLPFVIGPSGIELAEQTLATESVPASVKRITTGVKRLDDMLNGGYFRGSSILISGLPGTAKSTLCGAYIEAACQRGERALYVSFDERSEETIRNLASIGVHLGPLVRSGRLVMMSVLSSTGSSEVQLLRIRRAIREFKPSSVVIDPISALGKSSSRATARCAVARFMHWAKAQGITLVGTSLLAGNNPELEATDLEISTLADTWIHLAYAARAGERNRSITIIKSRGTKHSRQVRELLLSEQGISVQDVYQAGGEVLMGTLRWEQENIQRDAKEKAREELRRKRLDLERSVLELRNRTDVMKHDLAAALAELKNAKREERENADLGSRRQQDLLLHRDESPEQRVSLRRRRVAQGKRNGGLR